MIFNGTAGQSANTESEVYDDAIVGESPRIRRAIEEAKQAGKLDAPVLILGESGTGKELLARLIHNGRGPFVVIDCTHLSKELAERELFGHVRGAFTGAHSNSPGLIQCADGGTAFFDEIGELSLELQVKLLRLLEEQTFRPVGSTKECRAVFRVIAATNRDLKHEVACGRWRQDLYYRLNVIRIDVPRLVDRKEDIPLLVNHFALKYNVRLSAGSIKRLCEYQWPGNVRELKNVVYRMAVRALGNTIGEDDLPETIHESIRAGSPREHTLSVAPSVRKESSWPAAIKLPDLTQQESIRLSDLEKVAIVNALSRNRDRKHAAANLGISRKRLYRRLKEIAADPRFKPLLEPLGLSSEVDQED